MNDKPELPFTWQDVEVLRGAAGCLWSGLARDPGYPNDLCAPCEFELASGIAVALVADRLAALLPPRSE